VTASRQSILLFFALYIRHRHHHQFFPFEATPHSLLVRTSVNLLNLCFYLRYPLLHDGLSSTSHKMQFLTLLLAAAPALVSARGSLGFALGDKNADGTCKFQADYAADFKTMSGTSKLVRVYAASDCNTAKEILPAAKAAGFQVILGIW
jgi:hypothetical protein